jgi:hypothetical protein
VLTIRSQLAMRGGCFDQAATSFGLGARGCSGCRADRSTVSAPPGGHVALDVRAQRLVVGGDQIPGRPVRQAGTPVGWVKIAFSLAGSRHDGPAAPAAGPSRSPPSTPRSCSDFHSPPGPRRMYFETSAGG